MVNLITIFHLYSGNEEVWQFVDKDDAYKYAKEHNIKNPSVYGILHCPEDMDVFIEEWNSKYSEDSF